MSLVDYLRRVIKAIQADYGFSEEEASALTFNLPAVLCISDAQWQGYAPEATGGAVVQLHGYRLVS